MLYSADAKEVWLRAKQIHTLTGAKTMAQTLQRGQRRQMFSEGAHWAQKGMPPMGGLLNTPTPNQDEYNEGKAIYINQPGFYSIVLGSKMPERKAFKRWVAYEVHHGAQIKSPHPTI